MDDQDSMLGGARIFPFDDVGLLVVALCGLVGRNQCFGET
jgi:hypothetical protein